MLTIRDITINYGPSAVLRDVSFELRAGEIIALLGANGAGKTTLIKALNGTLPISSGAIFLDDRDISGLSRREIAQNIAVVAQENETKFPVTILQFVLSGRFARGSAFGWETGDDLQTAERAMDMCDLRGFDERLMNELSGGERQRVVLARALATEARILLLDEPTANLDLAHQAMMFRLVRERCRRDGYAAIVITHDLNLASEFADRIAMLNAGRMTAIGKPADVMTEENLHDVFGVNVLLDQNPASRRIRVTTIY